MHNKIYDNENNKDNENINNTNINKIESNIKRNKR